MENGLCETKFSTKRPVSEFHSDVLVGFSGSRSTFPGWGECVGSFWMMIDPTPKIMVPKLGKQPIKNGWTEPESFYPS